MIPVLANVNFSLDITFKQHVLVYTSEMYESLKSVLMWLSYASYDGPGFLRADRYNIEFLFYVPLVYILHLLESCRFLNVSVFPGNFEFSGIVCN